MHDPVNINEGSRRNPLAREAADLWLRLQASPHDEALREEARQWRDLSAAHERIFAATEETWALAGELNGVSGSPPGLRSPRKRPPLKRPPLKRRWRQRRGRIITALAGAATAACLAIIAMPTMTLLWQADYRTGTGEKRTISLADGSSVMLDTGSAIAVDYAGGQRAVRLLSGRAWFDVAKDARRPFTVAVAEAHVTVTGTAFDVGFDDTAIDVALARGGVRVDRDGAPPIAMTAGERLHIARSSLEATRSESAIASMGSWCRDRLLLENVSLADGVARLRRYYPGAIVLTGAALGQRRVTGVFDTGEPADALRLMVRQHHATVRQITPWLLIVSEK